MQTDLSASLINDRNKSVTLQSSPDQPAFT
jgi:hypothetical protein